MKNKISDKERLLHILDSIDSITDFTQNISYQQYIEDFKLRLALIKLLEIIGEAANGITEETQGRFSEVEWSILKSVRNVLVHEYFGIDYDIIWNTIKDRIPELKQKISNVLLQL
ncbi:MAG: HepT-like ribonuclease domain-containing protein [Bacteroidota bacterium]